MSSNRKFNQNTPWYYPCIKEHEQYETSFAVPHKFRYITVCYVCIIFERKNKIQSGKNYFAYVFGGPNGYEAHDNQITFKNLTEDTVDWKYFSDCCLPGELPGSFTASYIEEVKKGSKSSEDIDGFIYIH